MFIHFKGFAEFLPLAVRMYLQFDIISIDESPRRKVKSLTHSHTITHFDAPGKQAYSHTISIRLDNFLSFSSSLKLSSAQSYSLEESQICRLVMG